MTVYKLVTQDMKSGIGKMKWELGVKNEVEGELRMCDHGIHVYSHPMVAVLMNNAHCNIQEPILLECTTRCKPMGDATKWVVRSVTPKRKVDVPEMTIEHRVATGILCAMEVYKKKGWVKWAKRWLSGNDRTAADAAAYVAYAYADAANAAADAADASYVAYGPGMKHRANLIAKIEEARQYLIGGKR